jgi:hypothetical protein
MKDFEGQKNFWEVAHYPLGLNKEWDQEELRAAARQAKCNNTGWPIGVVLSSPKFAPKPLADGIEASMSGLGDYDYWSLNKSGVFYFLRRFEEDSEKVKASRVLFFDTRIWRIAEVFLHCSKLYTALGVPATTEISLQISHHDLKHRGLSASRRERAMTMYERECHEEKYTWDAVARLDDIEPNLEELVKAVLGPLFMLFDYWKPDPEVWKSVVTEFLTSRVGG